MKAQIGKWVQRGERREKMEPEKEPETYITAGCCCHSHRGERERGVLFFLFFFSCVFRGNLIWFENEKPHPFTVLPSLCCAVLCCAVLAVAWSSLCYCIYLLGSVNGLRMQLQPWGQSSCSDGNGSYNVFTIHLYLYPG